jgi:hypothetical protein
MMQQKTVTVNYETARENMLNEHAEGMSSQMSVFLKYKYTYTRARVMRI